MKTDISILLFLIISTSNYSQTANTESIKIATFCKVWGFLKYYHPKVAQGKFDWDKQLIEKLPLVKTCNTKQETSSLYVDWINSLGNIKTRKHLKDSSSVSFTRNLNIGWINDTTIFTNELISKLNYIKDNRAKHRHYVKKYFLYAFFKEKKYNDSVFPSEGLRLVGLFRYWNIINYFYPYKYLIGQDWDNVLTEMIPKFLNPKDTIEYHLAMLELTTKINDSHAGFYTRYTYWKNKSIPTQIKIIDNKAVIVGYYNDSLCRINDLKYGDVIMKVNNDDLSKVISDKSRYIGASNEPAKLNFLSYSLLAGESDSVQITFERNNEIKTKYVKRYSFRDFHFNWDKDKQPAYKELNNNIGYVNMGFLERSQVKKVMKNIMDKKAIIFDLRCYPKGTGWKIVKYLSRERLPYSVFLTQDIKYPGMYKWAKMNYCGKRNERNYYKGQVIVLLNEGTISHAENTCMVFKTAPNVTFIGSQTAGADGDVFSITFPGGYETYFSGIGVYYPDGGVTQRIGIIPDIIVKPTIEEIKSGKDGILEKAIEFINGK